jgi:hypothetical protein
MEANFHELNAGCDPPKQYNSENISNHWKHDLKPVLLEKELSRRVEEEQARRAQQDEASLFEDDVDDLLALFLSSDPDLGNDILISYAQTASDRVGKLKPKRKLDDHDDDTPKQSPTRPTPTHFSDTATNFRAGGRQVADSLQRFISTAPDFRKNLLLNPDLLFAYKPMEGIEEAHEGEKADRSGSSTPCAEEEAQAGQRVDRASGRIQRREVKRDRNGKRRASPR